jgi:hypothetical protein
MPDEWSWWVHNDRATWRLRWAGVELEHVCCAHLEHVRQGGAGCCAPGHSAYLLLTGQRPAPDDAA